jgi:hypothetical protein
MEEYSLIWKMMILLYYKFYIQVEPVPFPMASDSFDELGTISIGTTFW